ncbi:MAG: ParB/RepB/Spo0J family partition protein [Deltaproteobacteria bacterium]|nr:ParB/RepB/Spo0J family partition protein [Deltaproteobacteria bacterium]
MRKQLDFSINPLLSGPTLNERTKSGSPYRELNIDDIDVDLNQPRKTFDEQALSELAESIKVHGVLCPILVKAVEGGTFRIIAGERRYRASKLAGCSTIPAVVSFDEDSDSPSILAKQLIENLQRSDINPLERAIAIGDLREKAKWSIREIASNLGISKGSVQRSLEVLLLPDDLKAALSQGESESKVLMLSLVEDRELRKILLEKLDSLTRENIKAEIEKIGLGKEKYHGGTQARKAQTEHSESDRRIIDDLQNSLRTKVNIIRGKSDDSGKLIIEFYSSEDLSGIFDKLVKE